MSRQKDFQTAAGVFLWANNTIISFNTVCNLDPTILAYFYADAGRKFGRTEDGWEEEF